MAKTQTSQSLRRGTPARPDETETTQTKRDGKPLPKEEPAKTYMVNSEGTAAPDPDETRAEHKVGTDTADVRIGPGDAGEQAEPNVMERQPDLNKGRGMSAIVIATIIAAGLLLIVWLFT